MLETVKTLSTGDIYLIVTGIVVGTAARLFTLKIDLRQMPTYPSAYFNSVILGFIASCLGALAVPAIMAKDFTAVTFLTLAVTQFREVRTTERDSLGKLEHTEYVSRGEAYIDGISKTFESRNYISLVSSLMAVLAMKIAGHLPTAVMIIIGVLAGFVVMYLCHRFTKGKTIAHICTVSFGKIDVRGSELYVDDMYVTNYLGAERSREMFKKEGIAVVLTPREPMSRLTLDNYGQRQAILYEAVRTLGVKRYKFMRKNFTTGKLVIAFVPLVNNPDKLMRAVSRTPILENSRKVNRLMKTSLGG